MAEQSHFPVIFLVHSVVAGGWLVHLQQATGVYRFTVLPQGITITQDYLVVYVDRLQWQEEEEEV